MKFEFTKLEVDISPMKNGEFTNINYSYRNHGKVIGSIDLQIENELYKTHKGQVTFNLLGKLKDYIRSL